MTLPEVATAARLSLRPGDRLVLSFDYRLDDASFDAVTEQVKTWGLPEDVKVIILDQGQSLQVLAREDS
jgi:hypothetical protein